MEHMWAPWRVEYIQKAQNNEGGCFLCEKLIENNDESNLVLYRGETNFIVLNLYPYNPGHLLIAPYRHLGNIDDLTDAEANEHFSLIKLGVKLLDDTMRPTGFNIGMNLARVAGAGLPDHIHTHIVPRWQGDTSFISVVSETRVLSEGLSMTYNKLKEALGRVL